VTPRRVRVEANAKLNLGLTIGPRRPDRHHDLVTVFQSISLHDTLTAEWRPAGGFTLAVRSAPERGQGTTPQRPAVPRGAKNLVLRAARLVRSRFALKGGTRFTLVKRIPVEAGLGGGSADAAATIVALARLHDLRLPLATRLALGGELGADVPFALFGGTAVGEGRGERLRRLRLVRPFRAVVALPQWRVSTARAFLQLDRRKYGLTRWLANLRFAQSLGREALRPEKAARRGNTFEEVLQNRRSEFLSLRSRLARAGAEEPHLTGSGSAVYGFIPAGLPGKRLVERFVGNERLFLVRSRSTGLTLTTLP
jgi:4-diphosphocytidyl-2-C-methyl-D-erythritol kinase